MTNADRKQPGSEDARDCGEPSPPGPTYPGDPGVAIEGLSQAIIDNSQDCIQLLDLDGRLQYMSPSGQRLLNIGNVGRYLNMPYQTFWQGSDTQAALEAIALARSGGIGRFQGHCPTEDGIPK